MKTLLLLRHAKSSWEGSWTSDMDRPLNDRGRKDAPLMGKVLKKYELLPDLVLCSPAVRTRETAELFLDAANYDREVRFVDQLYDATRSTLTNQLSAQGDETTILLIGHNPGMAELLASLVGGVRVDYPTAGLACLDFDADNWRRALTLGGSLRWFVIPRLIKAL